MGRVLDYAAAGSTSIGPETVMARQAPHAIDFNVMNIGGTAPGWDDATPSLSSTIALHGPSYRDYS